MPAILCPEGEALDAEGRGWRLRRAECLRQCSIYGPDSQTICSLPHHLASYSGSSCAADVQGSGKERNAVLLKIGMKL